MGICTNKLQDKTKSQTKILNIQTIFQNVTFYFSTENLKNITSNVVVLFVDQQLSVKNNSILKKLGKTPTRLVQQFLQQQLQNQTLEHRKCLIFKNPGIVDLNFEYLAFICIQLWDKKLHTRDYLQQIFQNTFELFKRLNLTSLCFTEIDFEYGYPSNLTSKAFVKALHEQKKVFKEVTVVFNDINHRNIYMGAVKAFENELVTTDNQNASIAQSVYF